MAVGTTRSYRPVYWPTDSCAVEGTMDTRIKSMSSRHSCICAAKKNSRVGWRRRWRCATCCLRLNVGAVVCLCLMHQLGLNLGRQLVPVNILQRAMDGVKHHLRDVNFAIFNAAVGVDSTHCF